MSALAASLAMALAVEPQAAAGERRWSDGDVIVRSLDHEAQSARRRRIRRASLGISMGSLQTALGIYGVASPRFDDVMRRSAIALMLLGTAELSMGIYGSARRSSLERLQRGPEYTALAADPSDADALHRLRMRWADDARQGRTWRYIMGGGYLAGGVGLAVIGTVFLFPDAGREPTERLWAFTTLGTGVALLLHGSVDIAIHSDIERSYEANAAVFGWPSHRPRRRLRAKVMPTLGGLVVSGTF